MDWQLYTYVDDGWQYVDYGYTADGHFTTYEDLTNGTYTMQLEPYDDIPVQYLGGGTDMPDPHNPLATFTLADGQSLTDT